MSLTKACSGCGEVKPLAMFGLKRGCKDGHRTKCRRCTVEENRAYRAANPEKCKAVEKARFTTENYRERQRQRYAADPTLKERSLELRAKQRACVSDAYVRQLLRNWAGYADDEITAELIGIKRDEIIARRAQRKQNRI